MTVGTALCHGRSATESLNWKPSSTAIAAAKGTGWWSAALCCQHVNAADLLGQWYDFEAAECCVIFRMTLLWCSCGAPVLDGGWDACTEMHAHMHALPG